MSKHKLNPKLSTEEMERTSSPIISYLNLHPVKPDTIRKKSEQNNVQSSKMLPVETESNPYLITNNLNGVPVVDINTMPKTKKSDKKQVQSRKLSAAKIESSSNSVINNQKLHPAELKKYIKLKELEKKDKTKHKTKPVQDTLEKNLSPTFKCKLKSFKFKAVKEQKNDNDERREQRSKTAQPKKSYKRESQTNSEQIKDVKKTRKFIKELNKVMMEVGKEQRNQIFQTVRHFVSESDIDKSTLKEVKVVENAVNDDGIRNNINKDQPAESIATTDTKSIKTKLKRGRPPIKKKKDVIGTGLEEATKISSTTGTSQRCSSSIAVDMVLEDVVNKCYVEDTEQDDELTQLLGPFQVDFVSEDGVNECYVGNAIEDKPSTQVLGLHPINFVTENRNKSPIANTDEDNQLAQPSGSLFVDSIPEDFVNKCYVTNTDKDEQLTQVACPLPVELIPEDVINKCYVENMDKDELLVQVSDPIHVGLVEGIMDKYYVANADENDSTQVPGLANTDEDEQVNHMDLVIENVVNKCYKTTKVSGPDHIGKRLKAVQSSPGVFEHSRKNSKIKNVRKEKIKVESHRKRKNKSNCNGPVKKRKKDKEISQTAYDLKDLKIVLEDVYLNQALVAKYLNSHLEDDEYSSTRKTLVNFSQKSNNAIDKTSDILHDDQFNLRNGICITIPKIDRFSSSINEFSLTRDMLNTLPDKSNLLVTRTLSNLSAEKEVNLSAEKEVNLSAENEVNLSAEKEVNLSAEKEVNLSAEKEVNLSAEKEVNLSAENEVNLSAEKEVNLSAEKEVNLSAEKEVNLSAEKEVNLSAEKEVNLSAENEVNLSAENEVNLSAEKEVNLSAEKEVNLSAEKEVNLSAEKEVNLSAENEVNLSAENEVNLSAENEVNLSDESNKIFNNKNQLVVCKGLDISISKLNRFNRRYSFSSDSSQDEFSPAHDTVNILPDKSNRLTRTSLISNSENKVNLSDKSNVPLPQIFDNSLNRNFSSVEDRPNFNNLSNIGETSSSLVLNSSGNLCSTTNDQYNDRTNDRVSASKIWVPRITFNRNTDNRVVECSSLKNSGVFEDELYYSDEYEIDETYSNEEEMEFEFDPYLWNIKYKFSSEEKICIQSHDSIFKNATLSSKSNLDEFPFTTNILNEWLINHQTSQSKFRSPNLPPAKRPPRRLFQKSETSVSSREGSISNKLDKTLKPEPELNEDDTISLYAESITSHLFTSRKLNQLSPVKVISENAVQCEDTSFNKLSSVPLSDRSPAPQSVDSNENVESWINTNFNTNARGPWKCSVFMQLCYHFYFYKCKKRYCRYMHEMAKEVEDNILQLNLDDLMDAYNCTLKSMKLFNSTVQIFLKAFVNFKSVTSIVELGQDSLSRASDKRVILEKCISGLESIGIEFYDAVLKLTEYFETSILLSDILFDIIASQSPDKIVNNLEIVRKLLTNRQSWAVDYGVVSDIMSKSYISNNIELARFALLDILNCRRVDEKLIDVDIHRKFFELLTKHEVEDRDTYFNQLISLEILSWDTYEFIRPPNFEYNETGANTNSFNAAEVNLNNLNKSNSEDHLLDCANRSIDLEVRSNSSFKRCSKSPSEHSSKLIRSKCGILETASSDANLNKCDDDYDEENCLEYNSSNSSPTAVLAEDDVVRSQNLDLESNCNILLGSCAPLAEDELKILSKIINEGDYLGFTVKLHEIQDTPLIRSFVLNSICLFKQKEPADAYKMFISLFNGLKYLCDSPKGSSMRNILKMLTINMVIIFEHSKAYNEAARVLLQYRDKLDELTEVEWFKKINGCNLSKMGKLLYFCKVLLRGGYLRDCIDLFMDPNLKLMCQKNMWTIQNSGNYDVNFRNDVLREVLKKTIETDISLAKILILHLITEKNHISEIAIWKYFNNLLYAMMHKKEDVYREDIKGILDNILAGWYTHLSTLVLRGLVVVLVTHISESDALNLYSKCCKKSIYAKIKGDESTLTIRTDFSVEEIFLTIRYYFHKLIKTRCEGQDITLKLIIPDAIEAKLQLIINNDSILQFKHKIYGILATSFPYTIFVKDNGAEPSIQIKFEQLQKCVDYYRKNKGCQ